MPEAPSPHRQASMVAGRLLQDQTKSQIKCLVAEIRIEPTTHQLRVSKSLAKLNIPSWYSDHTTKQWRPRDRSSRPGSWRRRTSGTQSAVVTRPTTPDRVSQGSVRCISSSRSVYQNRWSCSFAPPGPLPVPPSPGDKENNQPEESDEIPSKCQEEQQVSTVKSKNSFLSYRQPYMGWRAQERLKLNSSYLQSPTQRLASSLLNPPNLSRIAE